MFPQAVKTLRSGDTRSISLGMYALFTSGVALWALYGVMVGDGPVLLAHLITLTPAAVVLQRRIASKKTDILTMWKSDIAGRLKQESTTFR